MYAKRLLLTVFRAMPLALLSCNTSAQDVALEGFGKVALYTAALGYYEYAADGVPVLGLITHRMPNDKVKFTMCNNATIEVELRQLKVSTARCTSKSKDPGPWKTTTKAIEPFYKSADTMQGTVVKFEGKKVSMDAIPEPYKGALMKAKIGDTVGFAFTDEQGKKSLAILDSTSSGSRQ